jgi:hypothetical protein
VSGDDGLAGRMCRQDLPARQREAPRTSLAKFSEPAGDISLTNQANPPTLGGATTEGGA